MEIWVETRLTGRELREEILRRHGGRDAVAERAAEGDVLAQDDLMMLELMEEEPGRLHEINHIGESVRIDEREFRLTPPRLKMIRTVRKAASAQRPLGITDLAHRLKRNKKNVSQEVTKLERWGLLHTRREGARKLVLPGGNEIRLVL